MAATNLLISGGPVHDFPATTAAIVDALAAADVSSTVVEDPRAALARVADPAERWDMVTVNALRWTMGAERHAPLRDEWAFTIGADEMAGLDVHVRSGGGLLACHTAVICFDADPRWRSCLGASWDWERSTHPPPGPVDVDLTDAGRRHPVTQGLAAFTTVDEVYSHLDIDPDVEPLMTSGHDGVDQPMLWTRTHGRGRVVVDLLGHDAASVAHPAHRQVLQRAARWLLRRTDGAPPDLPARPERTRP